MGRGWETWGRMLANDARFREGKSPARRGKDDGGPCHRGGAPCWAPSWLTPPDSRRGGGAACVRAAGPSCDPPGTPRPFPTALPPSPAEALGLFFQVSKLRIKCWFLSCF